MVYGLNSDKINAARIFNLFCLYGNVVRVKFLWTKKGCAMVQMGDALAVRRVVLNLNNTPFFGSKMHLGFSKQAFLADVQAPYQLTDGTPSFQGKIFFHGEDLGATLICNFHNVALTPKSFDNKIALLVLKSFDHGFPYYRLCNAKNASRCNTS